MHYQLDEAIAHIEAAQRPVSFSGSGLSAESGIPTFRGQDGLWKNYRAEELATNEAFQRDPALVWEWYEMRLRSCRHCEPNAGHRALAGWEGAVHITQNVDNLLERAGAETVHHLHGELCLLRCVGCGRERYEYEELASLPPRCLACGELERPGVVWFGEPLPHAVWMEAEKAARACDLMLVVGTSGAVWPAAGLVPLAAQTGAVVIEVNPEPSEVSSACTISLRGTAADLLAEVLLSG